MAQDDPAAGIKNWEEKFWSLDGLLKPSSAKSRPSDGDPNWNRKEVEESFRKAAQRKSDPKKLGQRKKSKRSGASRTLGKRAAKRS